MPIAFAGDIHGNTTHLHWVFAQAAQHDVTHIVSVGDFGFWPHTVAGRAFIDSAARLTKTTRIKLLFIDGNHENHDVLHELVQDAGRSNPIQISHQLFFIPRGCVTHIDGHTVMGWGGAVSVDKRWRQAGTSWWDRESISVHDVDSFTFPANVDILVTHEAPVGEWLSYKDDVSDDPVFAESSFQRQLVTEIQQKVQPKLHICGHHHTRVTWCEGDTVVHVLDRDGTGKNSLLII